MSADLVNYAGTYRSTPEHLAFQARAENLGGVHDLIVNKEQRIPDVAYFRGSPDPVSNDDLREGRTFAINGPLLNFTLGGKTVGDELELRQPSGRVPFAASLRSLVPVNHWEVICNGRPTRSLEIVQDGTYGEVSGTLSIDESGWCLARAWNDQSQHPVLDIYPYTTTSPI